MNSILVLGKGGQLGNALVTQLGDIAHPAGVSDVDFSQENFIQMLNSFTEGKNYQAVFNAAAYTQVDKAENEGRKLAWRINAVAVGELANWCKERKIPLIHYSTDYVYAGGGADPYTEKEPECAINSYGASKLEGDRLIAASGADYLIFRTSWVYDAYGKNFFNTMLRLFFEKEILTVISDQIGAPTYAPHLARASISALNTAFAAQKFPCGVYHLVGSGKASWYEFAQAIFRLATKHYSGHDSGQKSSILCSCINPILTSEYPTPAKRPLNSRLDCSKARDVLKVMLPDWEISLNECFKEKYESTALPDTGSKNYTA